VSDEQAWARRARSFSSVAEAYERSRPEYPHEAALWLTGDPPLDVVDLAAGTGKLTRVLVRLGHRVIAVEPLPEMLAELEAAVPGVAAHVGTAESMPLPDGSADAVVVAQAFHWFDRPAALREIARVLRPGGQVGLVWNVRDQSVPWVARLTDLIGGERLDDVDLTGELEASEPYSDVETAFWRWEQELDRERLRELVQSRSYCATLSDDERRPVLDAVDALYDEFSGPDGLVLPYVTEGFRATKRL
jgi:ubiquinone/menaquinone biosynthesis C-methylase UbiE